MSFLSSVFEIECKFKHIIKHSRNVRFEQLRRFFKAGVCVHLEKPNLFVNVYHKIITKKLEARSGLSIWNHLFVYTFHCKCDYILHLRYQVIFKADLMRIFNSNFCGRIGKLIRIFERSIIVGELLNCIVGKVNLCSLDLFMV